MWIELLIFLFTICKIILADDIIVYFLNNLRYFHLRFARFAPRRKSKRNESRSLSASVLAAVLVMFGLQQADRAKVYV